MKTKVSSPSDCRGIMENDDTWIKKKKTKHNQETKPEEPAITNSSPCASPPPNQNTSLKEVPYLNELFQAFLYSWAPSRHDGFLGAQPPPGFHSTAGGPEHSSSTTPFTLLQSAFLSPSLLPLPFLPQGEI